MGRKAAQDSFYLEEVKFIFLFIDNFDNYPLQNEKNSIFVVLGMLPMIGAAALKRTAT